jgi:hypothetical protein
MAEFMAALDPVNAVADASPGFVWRLQDDSGHATYIRVFDDPQMIINLSVWESLEALRAFTYRSDHTSVLTRRKEWFERLDRPHLALWWTRAGRDRRRPRDWLGSTICAWARNFCLLFPPQRPPGMDLDRAVRMLGFGHG